MLISSSATSRLQVDNLFVEDTKFKFLNQFYWEYGIVSPYAFYVHTKRKDSALFLYLKVLMPDYKYQVEKDTILQYKSKYMM